MPIGIACFGLLVIYAVHAFRLQKDRSWRSKQNMERKASCRLYIPWNYQVEVVFVKPETVVTFFLPKVQRRHKKFSSRTRLFFDGQIPPVNYSLLQGCTHTERKGVTEGVNWGQMACIISKWLTYTLFPYHLLISHCHQHVLSLFYFLIKPSNQPYTLIQISSK